MMILIEKAEEFARRRQDLTEEEKKQVLECVVNFRSNPKIIQTDEESLQLKKSLNLLRFGHRPKKRRVFQLFSVRVEFDSDKQGQLYGFLGLSEWSDRDDYDDVVFLFDRQEDDNDAKPHPILNKGFISLTDPVKPYHSFSSCNIEIPVELYVCTEDKKFEVMDLDLRLDLSKDRVKNSLNICKRAVRKYSEDTSVTLNYMVLDRAVDATVEVLFKSHDDAVRVYGKILASYAHFNYSCASHEVDHYKTKLFEANKSCPALLETGKFPLARSMLAVPWGHPLVIDVQLTRADDDHEILVRTFRFYTKAKDSSTTGCIEGTDCTLEFKVNWKCEKGTT